MKKEDFINKYKKWFPYTNRDRYTCEMLEDIKSVKWETPSLEKNNLQEQINNLISALEEIKDPISAMKRNLNENEKLGGNYAVRLSQDYRYLQAIANKALDNTKTKL